MTDSSENKNQKDRPETEEEVQEESFEEIEDFSDDDFSLDDEEESESGSKKTLQNYLAAVIILGGLFAGSLFVDVAQLVKGEGISQKKLADADVFSIGEETWVKSTDPMVEMIVINDEACEECQPETVIEAIKQNALPTVVTKKVAVDSEEGKKLIEKFGVKAIPAFIFGPTIKDTAFYEQAQMVLEEKDGQHLLNNTLAGIPSGKFVTLPEFKSAASLRGNEEAPVKIMVFSDFQCPFSKSFSESLATVYKERPQDIQIAFRNLPLETIHPQARNAAIASLCANDQGKFWEMHDLLFSKQSEWGAAEGTDVFSRYATTLGLNAADFKECLASDKHLADLEADEQVAVDYALSGTPAVFVGETFQSGSMEAETLDKLIDKELGVEEEKAPADEEAAAAEEGESEAPAEDSAE